MNVHILNDFCEKMLNIGGVNRVWFQENSEDHNCTNNRESEVD